MTQLPPGWTQALLGEVAATSLGKMLDSKRNTGANPVPYLRNINVRWGAFDLRDLLTMDIRPDELDRVLARRGDVIACEGGEPGRAAVWPHDEPIAIQKALHLIKPRVGVNPGFIALMLRHQASSGKLDRLFTGTTIKHLPQEKLRLIEVPLPPTAEQVRIVAAIEEAFSLLDAGEAGLHDTRKRLKRMRDSVLTAAVTGQLVPQHPTDTPAAEWLASQGVGDAAAADDRLPASWSRVRLGDVAEVKLGRQRSPARASGPRMRPYLRAANVGWNGLKLDDVKEMDFTESESAGFELVPGDLLLSEASGSPGEVGKPGQYRGEIEGCCFQNTLIRVRLRAGWNPDFYEHYFRQQALAGEFAKGSRGVGIHHLGRKALSDWLTPVPPPEEQARIVAEVERLFSFIEAAERAVGAGLARSAGLRRSVLQSAFEGRLVEQDPADEPASALLERIAAERVAVPRGRAPRRARGKVEAS